MLIRTAARSGPESAASHGLPAQLRVGICVDLGLLGGERLILDLIFVPVGIVDDGVDVAVDAANEMRKLVNDRVSHDTGRRGQHLPRQVDVVNTGVGIAPVPMNIAVGIGLAH